MPVRRQLQQCKIKLFDSTRERSLAILILLVMENYKLHRKLGSGSYAKVYLATHLPTGNEVALKLIRKKSITSHKMFERVHREMDNLKAIPRHANIVRVSETFEDMKYYGIAMECLNGGELFDYVLDKEGLSENAARDMFRQIVEAVHHCHSHSIIHRDLKLENILLDEQNKPKIADFGLSKEAHTEAIHATYCGSSLYAAPEMVLRKAYLGPECDVWSLGVILYTMLTATMPFDDSNFGQFVEDLENGEYPEPVGLSQDVRELISRLLDPTPTSRITTKEILSHKWLAPTSEPKTLKRRRNGFSLNTNESRNVMKKIFEYNECFCSCHKSPESHAHRDSVISHHCPDCEDIQSNDAEIMSKRQWMMEHSPSVCSSGYGGSEFGSQLTLNGRVSQCSISHCNSYDRSPVNSRRYSSPRNPLLTSLKAENRLSVPGGVTPVVH